MKYKLEQDYKELRASNYPSIADQLDAMWKGGKHLEEMQARIREIKERYPK